MRLLRTTGMFTRTTAFVLLVIWLPACAYRWRTDAPSAIRDEQPDLVRVSWGSWTEGRLIILRNPIVTEDSIVGIVQATHIGTAPFIPKGTRLAVALSEVTNLELREIDPVGNMRLTIPLLLVTAGALILIFGKEFFIQGSD